MDQRWTELLDAARRGDEWAWAEIYRAHAPRVLGYLRARRVADPDDLAAEIFLQVVRDFGRFQGDEQHLRSWIFSIAHNRVLDDSRYRARRAPTAGRDEADLERLGRVGNAEDEALDRLASEEIQRVLAQLSPDQRTVLLLRVFGDLTIPQIARITGRSVGAVKALQRRGLSALAEALESDRGTLLSGGVATTE